MIDVEALREEEKKENFVEILSWINPLFFPANKYWKWLPITKNDLKIPPKSTVELWNEDGCGWIFFALFQADNPKLTLQIDVYADTKLDINVDYETLYELGSLSIGQGYFSVTKYDDANNVYVAQYAPIGYGVPFRGKNRAVLYNPTTSEITLKRMIVWLITIKR